MISDMDQCDMDEEDELYCDCGNEPDEEELIVNACKSCGKPLD